MDCKYFTIDIHHSQISFVLLSFDRSLVWLTPVQRNATTPDVACPTLPNAAWLPKCFHLRVVAL